MFHRCACLWNINNMACSDVKKWPKSNINNISVQMSSYQMRQHNYAFILDALFSLAEAGRGQITSCFGHSPFHGNCRSSSKAWDQTPTPAGNIGVSLKSVKPGHCGALLSLDLSAKHPPCQKVPACACRSQNPHFSRLGWRQSSKAADILTSASKTSKTPTGLLCVRNTYSSVIKVENLVVCTFLKEISGSAHFCGQCSHLNVKCLIMCNRKRTFTKSIIN